MKLVVDTNKINRPKIIEKPNAQWNNGRRKNVSVDESDVVKRFYKQVLVSFGIV